MKKLPLFAASLLVAASVAHAQKLRRAPEVEVSNLLCSGQLVAGEQFAVVEVTESSVGTDLNGDGDTSDAVLHVHDWGTKSLTNLGLSTGPGSSGIRVVVSGPFAFFLVREASDGSHDLNADGDTADDVAHVYDRRTGSTTNLGYAHRLGTNRPVLRAGLVLWRVLESTSTGTSAQSADLNGDGDTSDEVLLVHELESGVTTALWATPTGNAQAPELVHGGVVYGPASEVGQSGQDLNGDGLVASTAVQAYDTTTGVTTNLALEAILCGASAERLAVIAGESFVGGDVNGDGDASDAVLHRYELATGTLVSEGVAVDSSTWVEDDDVVVLGVDERDQGDTDLNGDGDVNDGHVLHVYETETATLTNLGLDAWAFGDRFNGPHIAGGLITFHALGGPPLAWRVHVHDVGTGVTTNLGYAGDSAHPVAMVNGRDVAFIVPEDLQGLVDLNGDGDTSDDVVHVYDHATGRTRNLGLALLLDKMALGRDLVLLVRESSQGLADLNGDGDTQDAVYFVLDPRAGPVRNLRREGVITVDHSIPLIHGMTERHLLVPVHESGERDLNGDGDTIDAVLHQVSLGDVPLPRASR